MQTHYGPYKGTEAREGIAATKKDRFYKGRKLSLTHTQVAELGKRVKAGEN